MKRKLSFLALVGLFTVFFLQGIVQAKPDFPLSSFDYKSYYTDDDYIPSCVSSGSCAIFVDSANGSDDDQVNDGSKSKPYKSITFALTKVTSSKNVIAVAEGTYDGNSGENFPLVFYSDVQVLGGFYETFTKRDNSRAAHKSVVSLRTVGSNGDAETGFYINSYSVVVDGFEIKDSDLSTGTNSEIGGAFQVEVTDDDVAITNNTIHGNKAERGGAIYAKSRNSHILIAGNEIYDNEATTVAGGAIYVTGGTTVVNNVFSGNKSKLEAGAIYASGDSLIVGNVFKKNGKANLLDKGGALVATDNVGVYNNFFIANGKLSAVYLTGNSRFVNNTVVKSDGIGVQIGGKDISVVNNVSAYNSEKGIAPLVVSITGYVSENNATWQNGGSSKNTLECDPKFSSKDSEDPVKLKLGPGSSCIDTGQDYATKKNISLLEKDYFGGDRSLDGDKDGVAGVDPGAHEIEGDKVAATTANKVEIKSLSVRGNILPTEISFELSGKASVTLSVLDSKDVLVKKVVDAKSYEAGKQLIKWNQKGKDDAEVDYAKYTVKVEATNSAGTIVAKKEFDLVKADPNAKPSDDPSKNEKKDDSSKKESGNSVNSSAGDFSKCSGFIDVVDGSTLCPAISYVKEKKYFKGYKDGSFGYSRPISRAEVLKVVFLYTGQKLLDDDGTNLGFSDLIKKAWYMTYLRTAKEFKVVKGYSDGTFRPDRAVARNEFLKIFFVSKDDKFENEVKKAPFADVQVNESTSWYVKYVDFVRDKKLMDVDRAGNFLPASPMTRGEVAEFIYRFDKAGL